LNNLINGNGRLNNYIESIGQSMAAVTEADHRKRRHSYDTHIACACIEIDNRKRPIAAAIDRSLRQIAKISFEPRGECVVHEAYPRNSKRSHLCIGFILAATLHGRQS